MRVAINLLTDDPANPSGAHWFWTRLIPEMGHRLIEGEELHLLVSPKSRSMHRGYGTQIRYISFPCSNEKPSWRTISEHLYSPIRLPLANIDVFSTLMAPIVKPARSLVVHFKTMHAYTAPQSLRLSARLYRRMNYPHTAKVADAIIINSESLRREVQQYLDVDPAKLYLIPEAVDHELFQPDDRNNAAKRVAKKYGITRPFVLFVSSLWRYKNCAGLLRAFAVAKAKMKDRQLVVVGPGRDVGYLAELHAIANELGIEDDVKWVGGVPLEETVDFYRSADVFVYPSFNETFGLPILEAMASACPVVTSDLSAMPETAGDAALLADPRDPESLADAIVRACDPEEQRLRAAGPKRAAEFTWGVTAERTLSVYRDVHARHSARSSRR